MSREGDKISFSEGGGGINIIFGPKYRPLLVYLCYPSGPILGSNHFYLYIYLFANPVPIPLLKLEISAVSFLYVTSGGGAVTYRSVLGVVFLRS